ncbi:hypothetical protein ACIP9H_40395 [Streptomyces sp. NPDC088732]|uniref:hypothetical protein n=1 Tax=Streptomyces sp. NPDC088732 TaxID=3365879 RepID=UPI00382471F0
MPNATQRPADAWKRGRAATMPTAGAWVWAAGAVLNSAADFTPGSNGNIVLGGVALAATAATGLGAWAKGVEEKRQGLPGINIWQGAYQTACTCAAGMWVTWAAGTNPFGPYTVGSLVAGTLAAWLMYPWYRHSRRAAIAHDAAKRTAEDAPTAEGDLTDWERILADAGQKGVHEADRIETPGGYLLRLSLPEHGRVTYKTIEQSLDRIAVIAGRRLGLRSGGIRTEEGSNPSEVLLHITERDVLAELIPLPHDLALITSNDPFDIGVYEDGTPMEWDFLAHGMVVGMTDAGKSNFLNVLVKKGAQMVDVLLAVIDPKGGRFIKPWVQPLLDGKIRRPIIDWAATNTGPRTEGRRSPDEWHAILDYGCNEIDRRSSLGLGGTEKATTSPELPRIVIIVDECTDVVTDPTLLAKVTYIVRKGRSEGVIIILAGQRGTVTMFGSGDLKSQIRNRAGLGMTSQTDANSVFPNAPKLGRLATALTHQGTVLVQRGPKGRILPGKSYRIDPERDIEPLTVALTGRRPGLPEDAAAYHGPAYTGRWSTDRIRHLYATDTAHLQRTDTPMPAAPKPDTPAHPGGSTIGSTAARLGLPPSRILSDLGIGKTVPPEPEVSPEAEQLADELGQFLREQAPAPEPAGPVDERRVYIRRLVYEAGADGVPTTEIFARLRGKYGEGWNRTVVQTWLSDDVAADRMHRPRQGVYAHGPKPTTTSTN